MTTNNNCWYELNIDVSSALRKDFILPTVPPNTNITSWVYKPSEVLTQEWLNCIKTVGYEVSIVQIFWKKPNCVQSTAHLDVHNNDDTKPCTFGLNWTIGEPDSTMKWYSLPSCGYTVKRNSANTAYADWPVSELTEIDSHNVKNKITLVRTNVPHEVNTGPLERWCISVRVNSYKLTWENIIEDLRLKKILIERTKDYCWYDTKISVANALKPDFQLPTPKYPIGQTWMYKAIDIFNEDWLDYLKASGLEIGLSMVFWKNKNYIIKTPHVDVYQGGENLQEFGLNWTIKGIGSEMIWYKIPTGRYTVKFNEAGTPYANWPLAQLSEIERHYIGRETITLVKTGIPHEISVKEEERWSFSTRIKGQGGMKWETIVDLLRCNNLITERTD